MDKNRLQQLLAELHRELDGATAIDPESRRMLERVLADVRQLSPPAGGAGVEGATGQIREAALRLEAEHPRLAATLGQLGDALAKLGI